MTKSNIFALPSKSADAPIQEGDAVLIIRPGGEVTPMTVGIDQKKVDKLRDMDPHDMTEEEMDLSLQGQTLFLLSMAAQSDAIMTFLGKVASLPGETNMNKLSRAANVN